MRVNILEFRALATIPASPQMPIAIPATRQQKPTARPPKKLAYPCEVEYVGETTELDAIMEYMRP